MTMTALHALLLLIPFSPTPKKEGATIDAVRRFFAEAEAVSDADQGELWGVSLYGPMLFVDPVARRIYANEPVQGPLSDGAELEEHAGVFVGPQPKTVFAANAAQTWGGKDWTTIVWQTVPRATYRRRTLFAHEMFHRVQAELGFPARTPASEHLETRDGRVWLRLELRALSEALLLRGEARLSAIADALVFRAHRRSLFEGAAESERVPEMHEGLAQYTGVRLSTLPRHVLAPWLARRLTEDECGEGSDPVWMERRMTGVEGASSLERQFSYSTGPAYGLLLDEAAPRWRESVSKDDDLGELLRTATGLELPPELGTSAEERKESYEAWLVEADEDDRAARREREREVYRARLVDRPVLVLPLEGPRRMSFRTPDLSLLPGIGRVYERVEVDAAWGRLTVDSGGALSHLESNGTPLDVVVPVPGAPDARPLVGDGWTLELAPGWSVEPGERDGDLILRAP